MSQSVVRPHGELGVWHADVNVEGTLRGDAQETAQRVGDGPVPLVVVEGCVTPGTTGMDTDTHERCAGVDRGSSEPGERGHGRLGRAGTRRSQLDLGRVRLVPSLARIRSHSWEDLACDWCEPKRVRVDEQKLLFDSDGERFTVRERRHCTPSAASAAARPITSAAASPLA